MKKLFPISLMLVILTGCRGEILPRSENSGPDYVILHSDPPDVYDGMTTLLYPDREVTLLRFGERYGESLYLAAYGDKNGGKFGYERFVIPEEYAPPLGGAIKLTADIRADHGGIDGGITNYIETESVKECRELDITDKELCDTVPLWDEAVNNSWLPTRSFSSGAISEGLFVFKYSDNGEVYMISPEYDGKNNSCTLFKDGQPVARYGGMLCVPFEENGGENFYVVLCDEDLDVSCLDEPLTDSAEDFYVLGTLFPTCAADDLSPE